MTIVFKTYRKVVATRARVLSEQDHQERNGIIQTLEGPCTFAPGDYLARDAKGEWPIKQATLQQNYTQVAAADEEGIASYLRTTRHLAAPMPEPFIIAGLRGKAGDYLVLSGAEGGWPVDRELFEQTYRLVEEGDA